MKINEKIRLIYYKWAGIEWGIRDALFNESKITRLFFWWLLISCINNCIIEPLSSLSDRIPSGKVKYIPEMYVGNWEYISADKRYEAWIGYDKITYKWSIDNEEPSIVKCHSPEIYYDFSEGIGMLGKVTTFLKESFVPDTLFGDIQRIRWKCDGMDENPKLNFLMMNYYTKNILYEISIGIPYWFGEGTEYFYSESLFKK